jgi:hypothetical protein
MCLGAAGVRRLCIAGRFRDQRARCPESSVLEAVRFLAVAPVNLARLMVMMHLLLPGSQEWADLVAALGRHACHAFLVHLEVCSLGRGTFTDGAAAALLGAFGGLLRLRVLRCDDVGSLHVLLRAPRVATIRGCFLRGCALAVSLIDLSGLLSLRRVGNYFAAYTNVSRVVLPPAVVSIGYSFLCGCKGMVGCLDLSGLLLLKHLGANFAAESAVASVKLPAAVVFIGNGFLGGCGSLLGPIDLSGLAGLRHVGDFFAARSAALGVLLPAGVVSIGHFFLSDARAIAIDLSGLPLLARIGDLFAVGTAVARVDLPASVSYVGDGFLHRCNGLRRPGNVAADSVIVSHLPLLQRFGSGRRLCDVCGNSLEVEAAVFLAAAQRPVRGALKRARAPL